MDNKGHWFNNGPHIKEGYNLIVSTEINKENDYTTIALVPDEETKNIGFIVHAPEMYEIIHELVMLHLLKKTVGETALCAQKLDAAWFQAEQMLCNFVLLEELEPEDTEKRKETARHSGQIKNNTLIITD